MLCMITHNMYIIIHSMYDPPALLNRLLYICMPQTHISNVSSRVSLCVSRGHRSDVSFILFRIFSLTYLQYVIILLCNSCL